MIRLPDFGAFSPSLLDNKQFPTDLEVCLWLLAEECWRLDIRPILYVNDIKSVKKQLKGYFFHVTEKVSPDSLFLETDGGFIEIRQLNG